MFFQSHSRSVCIHTKQGGALSTVAWIKWKATVLSVWVVEELSFPLPTWFTWQTFCAWLPAGSMGKQRVGVKPAFLATTLARHEEDPFRTEVQVSGLQKALTHIQV